MAADARAALAAAGDRRPDLVIADLALGDVEGVALFNALRDDPSTAAIPMMAIAPADEEEQAQAWSCGADDVIVEPFSARELLARVKSQLHLARARGEALQCERTLRREAEMLHEVACELSAELDQQALVHKATEVGCKLTGAEFGAFFFNTVGDDGEKYLLYALAGALREAFESFGLPRNTALFGPTFRGEGVVRLADVLEDPRYGQEAPHDGMPPGHLPVRSYLAVPVKSRSGEVLGGLFFGHPTPGVFTEHAERLALSIAVQAAVALDNAQLYTQAKTELRERKRAEDELRDAEATRSLLASIVESSDEAIISKTLEGHITSWNAGAQRVFGYTAEEAVGRPITMLIPAERLPEESEILARLRRGERLEHFETVRIAKDGSRLDVSLSVSPVRDASGRVIGASKIARDVTERKRWERELAASEERFSRFMQHLPGLAWIKDAKGHYVFANEAAQRAFGASSDRLFGKTDEEVFPPETARQFRANDQKALTGEGVETIETLEQPDGVHHSLVSKFPIPGAGGAPAMIGGIAIDVTERVKAEQSLRDSEERFRGMTMNAPVAIYIKDLQGRYTLCNPLAAEALGRPKGVVGLTDHDLLDPAMADALRKHDQEVVVAGRAMEFEESLQRPGYERDFLSVKFPLRDSAGRAVGLGGVSVDVTDRKRAQRALQESEQRLGLATRTGKLGVWDWNIVDDRISWSESLYAIHGVGPEWFGENVGGFAALVYPEDREKVTSALQDALKSEAPYELEFRSVRPNGEVVWLFTNAVVLRENGQPVRMLGATMDITESKRGEAALRESEQRFRTLAGHAPVGIFQSDANGDNVFVNESWCEIAGMTAEQGPRPGVDRRRCILTTASACWPVGATPCARASPPTPNSASCGPTAPSPGCRATRCR